MKLAVDPQQGVSVKYVRSDDLPHLLQLVHSTKPLLKDVSSCPRLAIDVRRWLPICSGIMASFSSVRKIGLGTDVDLAMKASISNLESLSAIFETRVCHMFQSLACCLGADMSAAASAIASAKTFRQKGSQLIHSLTSSRDAAFASACALTLTR